MSVPGARSIAFAVTTLAIALTGCGGADGASSISGQADDPPAAPGVAVEPSRPRAATPEAPPAATAPGATVQRWPRTLQIA